MTGKLDDIRADIDTLDAELRAGLLRRAELVAQIAAAKAANGDAAMPVATRCVKCNKCSALRAWQQAEAPLAGRGRFNGDLAGDYRHGAQPTRRHEHLCLARRHGRQRAPISEPA